MLNSDWFILAKLTQAVLGFAIVDPCRLRRGRFSQLLTAAISGWRVTASIMRLVSEAFVKFDIGNHTRTQMPIFVVSVQKGHMFTHALHSVCLV